MIENNPTSGGDVPQAAVTITDSGALSPNDPSLLEQGTTVGEDPYEDYPDDEDRDLSKPESVIEISTIVRDIGNKLYKEGNIDQALQKYQSAYLGRYSSSISPCSLIRPESIRYLDTFREIPEDSPENLKQAYSTLLIALLLNSALAAIRSVPPLSDNAIIAIANTTRTLDNFELNTADKGQSRIWYLMAFFANHVL